LLPTLENGGIDKSPQIEAIAKNCLLFKHPMGLKKRQWKDFEKSKV
jgi:hypothetical protein